MPDLTGEVTELLQALIRNACVNDGTPESGGEVRNADLLEQYLDGVGLELRRFEPVPGRVSLLARLDGTDADAPSLLLMGHTDVVPANAEDWERDPFGGELVDGFVWGRGAADMLCLTASMAVAIRHLAASGRRLRGSLSFLAVADEEALGQHGARWLTEHEPDAVKADYVVTEAGGFPMPLPSTTPGPKLPVIVGEKGVQPTRIRIRGRAGHGSTPFGSDNAAVKAAEIVRRIAENQPAADIHDVWRRFLSLAAIPAELAAPLSDPAALDQLLAVLPDAALAGFIHAETHMTCTPTVVRSGVKVNVIPDRAEVDVDIRTLPGQTSHHVERQVRAMLGDLGDGVEIEPLLADPASASPPDSPLMVSLGRVTSSLVPGAQLIPLLMMGATDARFFRRLGSTAYGAGLFSEKVPFGEFMRMFHGPNERIDLESLRLSTDLWLGLAADLLG